MRFCIISLCALLLAAAHGAAAETVTVGGAVVPIAIGWKQSTTEGQVVLSPSDLPDGVACTFTLLGGEPFTGSVSDALAAEWKGLAAMGRMTTDDGEKMAVSSGLRVASHYAVIETDKKVSISAWLFVAQTNGRIEKMILVSTNHDTFAKYSVDVTRMMNGTKYVVPWDGKPALSLQGVCFGFVKVKTSERPECWIFLSDGVVYNGFPVGGLDRFDLDVQ